MTCAPVGRDCVAVLYTIGVLCEWTCGWGGVKAAVASTHLDLTVKEVSLIDVRSCGP